MDSNETDEQHGRLGRLFAALVGTGAPDPGDAPEAPTVSEGGIRAAAETSRLDLESLSQSLAASSHPVRALRRFVADVRERAGDAGSGPAPSAFETYLAERLEEAGVERAEEGDPSLRVVRPRTSGLFYLRIEDERVSWASKLRVLRIEAALNGAALAERALPDPDAAALDELVRLEARCARSVIAQAPELAARREVPARGEWAVRQAISEVVESARLPHRLIARFRVNVAGGLTALELDAVPASAWPATAFVDGLGVVPATKEMRRRAASDYNLRVGIFLAAYALMVAPELDEVWVAAVEDGPAEHVCRYSARLTRALLEEVDLTGPVDPWVLMRAAGANLNERDRTLEPVRQGFSLEDERLCPPRRWDAVELSEAELGPRAARELGAKTRDGLGVDEDARRIHAADELVRSLGDSTAQNVRALLDLAEQDPDAPDVRDAALRCVRELVEGALEDDPLAIVGSFVHGDPLEQGVAAATTAFREQRLDDAERLALDALASADATLAADGDGVCRRAFESYADRVLYNRLIAPAGTACLPLSHAYPEAHLLVSACALARGDAQAALDHARHASTAAPLSTQVSLHLSHCLEASGDLAGATDELRRLLSFAHDGETIGAAYLRMAQLQWQAGNVVPAQACYQLACARVGTPVLVAGLAAIALIGHVGDASETSLDADQVRRALSSQGIPFAPTEEVGAVLMGASAASVDAELFGVARDVVRSLCSVLRDDVLFGVYRSLEGEPDR